MEKVWPVCSCDKLGLKNNHNCWVMELWALFCVPDRQGSFWFFFFIMMEFCLFQTTHAESCGCPAGGAVPITVITVYDPQLINFFCFVETKTLSPKWLSGRQDQHWHTWIRLSDRVFLPFLLGTMWWLCSTSKWILIKYTVMTGRWLQCGSEVITNDKKFNEKLQLAINTFTKCNQTWLEIKLFF